MLGAISPLPGTPLATNKYALPGLSPGNVQSPISGSRKPQALQMLSKRAAFLPFTITFYYSLEDYWERAALRASAKRRDTASGSWLLGGTLGGGGRRGGRRHDGSR
jgi:hypothetical protein